jgi:hypothetical protein
MNGVVRDFYSWLLSGKYSWMLGWHSGKVGIWYLGTFYPQPHTHTSARAMFQFIHDNHLEILNDN